MDDLEKFTPLFSPMPSDFRIFCNEMWYRHKDEIFVWTGITSPEYDQTYYLKKHKWLLKKMYKDSKRG
jgi:hypothetical protein